MENKLSTSVYNGRPFGGTGILVRNHLSRFVMPVATGSPRVTVLQLFNLNSQDIVACSIYMPWNNNTDEHLVEFVSVLGCLQNIIDRHIGCLFVLGSDYNVERCKHNYFNDVLQSFCTSNNLCWAELEDDSTHYTFHSDVNDQYSLIDHFICSPPLTDSVKSTHNLIDGANTLDHLAIYLDVTAKAQAKVLPKLILFCTVVEASGCERLAHSRYAVAPRLGNRTRDLLIASPTPYRCATTPPRNSNLRGQPTKITYSYHQ